MIPRAGTGGRALGAVDGRQDSMKPFRGRSATRYMTRKLGTDTSDVDSQTVGNRAAMDDSRINPASLNGLLATQLVRRSARRSDRIVIRAVDSSARRVVPAGLALGRRPRVRRSARREGKRPSIRTYCRRPGWCRAARRRGDKTLAWPCSRCVVSVLGGERDHVVRHGGL